MRRPFWAISSLNPSLASQTGPWSFFLPFGQEDALFGAIHWDPFGARHHHPDWELGFSKPEMQEEMLVIQTLALRP